MERSRMFQPLMNLLTKATSPPPPSYIVPEPPLDPSEIAAHKIDFVSLGIPEYKDKTAIVIDHVFSPADCQKLYALTGGSMLADQESEAGEEAFSGNWEIAQISSYGDKQVTDTSYRNNGRMLVDTPEMAEWILQKVLSYLHEIQLLKTPTRHFVPMGLESRARARLVSLNERLRFLKYVPGNFFKVRSSSFVNHRYRLTLIFPNHQRHCDGLLRLPHPNSDSKGTLASYYTLQIYLNGSPTSLIGGSTRIFSPKNAHTSDLDAPLQGPCIDIPSRTGRVLVFEQSDLLHSGEPVQKGVKISIRTDFMYEVVYIDDDENAVGSGSELKKDDKGDT
jgi:hypothetical protein